MSYLEKILSFCKEHGLEQVKSENQIYVYDTNFSNSIAVHNLSKFVSTYHIKSMRYYSDWYLSRFFKGCGKLRENLKESRNLTFLDHIRIAKDARGKYILILQPYLSEVDCREYIKELGITCNYKIEGKSASFHSPGYSCLVLIFCDDYDSPNKG